MLEKIFPTKKSQRIFIVIFYIVITGFFGGFLKISPETFTQFTYIFTGLLIGYGVFFETEKIENFLINNITKISFILIIGFFLLPAGFVEINKEIFYIIGAIFAFWYGYKKYERDKELEWIRNFKKMSFEDIRIDWHCKKTLYDKGYIPYYIWKAIESEYLLILKDEIGILPIVNIQKNKALAFDTYKNLSALSKTNETKEYFEKEISGEIIKYLDSGKKFIDKLKGLNKEFEEDRLSQLSIIDKAIIELKEIYP